MPIADTGEGAGLQVALKHVERLGDVSMLYVDQADSQSQSPSPSPSQTMTVRVERSARSAVGAVLTLRLLAQHLHLFDSAGLACRRTSELPS